MLLLEECVRVDVQGSTGWTARLATKPGARYRSWGVLSDQPAHHHHTGKHLTIIQVDALCIHALYRFIIFVLTKVDAGGKCPRCSDDWRDPTKSNHTDGIVWDGEASQQVCVQVKLGYNRVKKTGLKCTSSYSRFREALVEFGKEHRRVPNNNKFYLHYLLASISNCIILK